MNLEKRVKELEEALVIQTERFAHLATKYEELLTKYEELLKENESLRGTQNEHLQALQKQNEELLEQLNQSSSNSNKPPSSDSPRQKRNRRKKKAKSEKKREAKRVTKGIIERFYPSEEVDEIVEMYPESCRCCGSALKKKADPRARRFQVTELSPIAPKVTEWRRHQVRCACGERTRAKFGPEHKGFRFGPRLCGLVVILTGVYRLSRRDTKQFLWDVFGVSMSLGQLSAIEKRMNTALMPVYEEICEKVHESPGETRGWNRFFRVESKLLDLGHR